MSGATLAITGATGFIGRHCVERARAEGTALRLFVRDMAKVSTAWQADDTVEIIAMYQVLEGLIRKVYFIRQ